MKAKKILNALNFKIKGFSIGFLIAWFALLAIGIVVDVIALTFMFAAGCVLAVIDAFYMTIDAFYMTRDTMRYALSRAKNMSVTKSVLKEIRNAIRNKIHKNKATEAIRRAAEFDPHTF